MWLSSGNEYNNASISHAQVPWREDVEPIKAYVPWRWLEVSLGQRTRYVRALVARQTNANVRFWTSCRDCVTPQPDNGHNGNWDEIIDQLLPPALLPCTTTRLVRECLETVANNLRCVNPCVSAVYEPIVHNIVARTDSKPIYVCSINCRIANKHS